MGCAYLAIMFLCVVVGCVKWIDGSLWGAIVWFVLAAVAAVWSFAGFSSMGYIDDIDTAPLPENGIDEPPAALDSAEPPVDRDLSPENETNEIRE
jgi:hypothetical protein